MLCLSTTIINIHVELVDDRCNCEVPVYRLLQC